MFEKNIHRVFPAVNKSLAIKLGILGNSQGAETARPMFPFLAYDNTFKIDINAKIALKSILNFGKAKSITRLSFLATRFRFRSRHPNGAGLVTHTIRLMLV